MLLYFYSNIYLSSGTMISQSLKFNMWVYEESGEVGGWDGFLLFYCLVKPGNSTVENQTLNLF